MENSDEADKCYLSMDPEGALVSDLKPYKNLEVELKDFGLDCSFWSQVFKDILDVTDTKQLQYLDDEDYKLLKQKIRYRWEGKALQKLLVQGKSEIMEKAEKKQSDPIKQHEELGASRKYGLDSPNLHEDHMTQTMAKELDVLEETSITRITNERPLKDCVEGLITRTCTNNDSKCLMDTHCHQVKHFPNRAQTGPSEVNQDVNAMFTPIQQFSDVITVLEKVSEDFQKVSKEDKNVTITCKVTCVINSWLETLKDSGLKDLVLLVQSVTKLVGHREDTFHPILGSQEIDFLIKELSDVHRRYVEFRKESTLKAQAFTLLTLLTATRKGQENSVDKQTSLHAFTQAMKEDIDPKMSQAIAAFSQHVNWEVFEEQLWSMTHKTSNLRDNSPIMGEQLVVEKKQPGDTPKIQDATKPEEGFPKLNIELASPYKELFERLDLLKYYPAKISNADIHNINRLSTCMDQIDTEKELWLHFIYKLLLLNVNVRFLCLEPILLVSSKSLPLSLDSFCDFERENSDSNANQQNLIHPMDIYMAVFHCSNDFVRQFIYNQLLKCHFAVPLLVPNLSNQQLELPVWPLQITALTLQDTEQSALKGSVLDIPLPVVSFMRLGTSRNSKSKIMNDIINKNGHPTFFSRHCRGSTATRLLLDGVAEITWYFPEGKKNDISESCVAFINLHGDACKHPKQTQYLIGISSVIVLLLPENHNDPVIKEGIDCFLNCKTPFIALFSGMETIDKGDLNRIAAKNRNEAELSQEIILKCCKCLPHANDNQKLKDRFEQGRQQGFKVGTEIEMKGREKAEALVNILYGEGNKGLCKNNSLDFKDVHLPLQGDLRMKWCVKDKEFHRLLCRKNMSIEQNRAQIDEEKQKIRELQQKRASPNRFMNLFLQYAVNVEEKERLYFLHWFRTCLDEALTTNVIDLKRKYNKTWLKYRESAVEEQQNDLCELSKRIKHATFGLQDVFREISQLYESHKSVEESMTIHGIALEKLPEIGVDLMLSGHPLELIDGDVNYVPIDWVNAVFEKLVEKLGDKRVLVLSVIGLQSSGKSTLLNSMFGLDFAVSAGPCTRGVFMHLLPVEEQMRDKLLFDYVFVLDTEGLRSNETDPDTVVKYDNELATLIIGISDITLINVMGENLCEIQNILQVCFQAFLRMKIVNIKPSCMFVHQNVSDITAKDKNQIGRIQLIKKLDEISRAAAEEENHMVTSFSDIIKFDVNSDVFYFKNLLEGDPPMASPNPSYSQNVQELKNRLLSISAWLPNGTLLTMSELSNRVKDIWNALLDENFVFNFRNSLHMKVYSDLERDCQRWCWKMRKTALETQRSLNCRVKSGELSSINESKIKLIFNDTLRTITTDINKYFTEDKHSDILSQWRVSIDRRLESLKEELTDETYQKGLKEVAQRRLKLELDSKMRQYESDLFQKSVAAASALKDQAPSEDLIKSEFSKLWIQWTNDLSSKNPKEPETNIHIMVENALLCRFEKNQNCVCNISKEDFQFDASKHVKNKLHFFSRSPQINQSGNDFSKHILENISKRITEKAADGNEVTENFIHEILEEIDAMFDDYDKSHDSHFTKCYKACISAYVCYKLTWKLKQINENVRSANDPIQHLMNQKEYFFQLYKRYCHGAESIKTFVSVLKIKLNEAMHCAVYEKFGIDIADYLRCNHAALRGNKSNFEHHIMKHLAEKENFEQYIKYIDDPKSFYRDFIRECVVQHIGDEQIKVLETLSSSWLQLTEKVLDECSVASEKIKETQGSASMWLDEICSRLGHLIPLSREDFRTIENVHIDNTDNFQMEIASSLKQMLENGQKDPKSLLGSGPIVFKLKEKPEDILFEQLSGCWEQCPFCKALCTNTIPNHDTDHTVEWHRCQAIGGLFHYRRYSPLMNFMPFMPYSGIRLEKHFVLDFCSTSVISDNEFKSHGSGQWISFKEYRNAGPPYENWNIQADNSERLYWKWFICTFSEQLEKKYNFKFEGLGKIPEAWKKIKRNSVLNEIDKIIDCSNN